jgi:hypothetical protein
MKAKSDGSARPNQNSFNDSNNNTISSSQTEFYNSVQVDNEIKNETTSSWSDTNNSIKQESKNIDNNEIKTESKTSKQDDAVDQAKATLQLLTIKYV